jgi:hypothetical protein
MDGVARSEKFPPLSQPSSLADAMRRYTILTLSGRCAMVIFPDPPGEYDFAMRALLSIGNTQKMENP